jgi:hemerythrin-like domain-containing protein
MNAIEMLESQHRQVETLFQDIENATSETRSALVEELVTKLSNHMQIEEEIFYPAAYDSGSSEVKHAYNEHDEAKPIMKEIAALKGDDGRLMTLVADLKEKISHHVEEEESSFFPRCESDLGEERLLDLAAEMEELLNRLNDQASTPSRERARTPDDSRGIVP